MGALTRSPLTPITPSTLRRAASVSPQSSRTQENRSTQESRTNESRNQENSRGNESRTQENKSKENHDEQDGGEDKENETMEYRPGMGWIGYTVSNQSELVI